VQKALPRLMGVKRADARGREMDSRPHLGGDGALGVVKSSVGDAHRVHIYPVKPPGQLQERRVALPPDLLQDRLDGGPLTAVDLTAPPRKNLFSLGVSM